MIKTEDFFFQRNMDSANMSNDLTRKMVVLAGKERDFAKNQRDN